MSDKDEGEKKRKRKTEVIVLEYQCHICRGPAPYSIKNKLWWHRICKPCYEASRIKCEWNGCDYYADWEISGIKSKISRFCCGDHVLQTQEFVGYPTKSVIVHVAPKSWEEWKQEVPIKKGYKCKGCGQDYRQCPCNSDSDNVPSPSSPGGCSGQGGESGTRLELDGSSSDLPEEASGGAGASSEPIARPSR